MYPTRAQVKARFQNTLDDPLGLVFDETVFAPAFGEAFDALNNALLQYQVPNIELEVSYTLATGTTSVTPATLGIADMGDFRTLSERTSGTTDKYVDMQLVDRLPQRDQGVHLGQFSFHHDTFFFVGATGNVDLLFRYAASGTAPTNDATVLGVDNALTFLSSYAVGRAGPRKGYEEIAAAEMVAAVGPQYNQGVIGGELFRLIQTRVRSMQKMPLQQKRFSAGRRLTGGRPAVPYATPSTLGTWG
jgi:hypothetical protein